MDRTDLNRIHKPGFYLHIRNDDHQVTFLHDALLLEFIESISNGSFRVFEVDQKGMNSPKEGHQPKGFDIVSESKSRESVCSTIGYACGGVT